MVILQWIRKLFAGRQKLNPGPTAETSVLTLWNRILPRRYRSYPINVQKQKQLRNISRNGIIRRGIERIKRGVLSLDYELVATGKTNKKQMEQLKLVINNVLKNPNIVHDYRAFFDMILEDLIVLDAGVFNKVKGGNPMRPLFLYPVDAITMEILQPYDFTNPNGDMFLQRLNSVDEKTFNINEIAYLKINHFTDTPYGLSPIETIWRYLNYFLDAIDNASDITSIDTSKFLVNFENATPEQLKTIREYIANEIEGTGKVPMVGGGKVNSVQTGAINSDALFLDFQKFLLTLCAKCLHLPESVFVTTDVNDRNNLSEVEQQILKEAVKPYADLIEKAINQHIIQTMGIYGVEFKFAYEETLEQKKQKVDIITKQVAMELLTIDEARVKLGEQPLNTKYSKCTIGEAKALINEDHPTAGGFNGLGIKKDNSGGKGGETG